MEGDLKVYKQNGGLTPEQLAEISMRRAMNIEGDETATATKQAKTWRDDIISLTAEYDEPIPVLVRGNDEFIHLGDIQMIEGHQGSKKTFLVSAMIAGALGASPDKSLGFEYCADSLTDDIANGKILYIDTEQNAANTYKVKKRVHRLAGLDLDKDNDRFIVLNQRGDTTDERLQFALDAIGDIRPTICFIDNLKDLGGDFNDLKESYNLVSKMMWATAEYNCAIVCVIHLNVGTNKARGHLGSALYEKVSLCISLEVEDPGGESITRVSMAKKSRNKRPEDFAFILDDKVLPRLTTPPVKSTMADDLRKVFEGLMTATDIVPAGILAKQISEKLCLKDSMARRKIKAATNAGVLLHYGSSGRDSRYQLKPASPTDDKESREEYDNDIPF